MILMKSKNYSQNRTSNDVYYILVEDIDSSLVLNIQSVCSGVTIVSDYATTSRSVVNLLNRYQYTSVSN